jgi:hypothetical protein
MPIEGSGGHCGAVRVVGAQDVGATERRPVLKIFPLAAKFEKHAGSTIFGSIKRVVGEMADAQKVDAAS